MGSIRLRYIGSGTIVLLLLLFGADAWGHGPIVDTIVFANALSEDVVVFAGQYKPVSEDAQPVVISRDLAKGQMMQVRPGRPVRLQFLRIGGSSKIRWFVRRSGMAEIACEGDIYSPANATELTIVISPDGCVQYVER